MGSACGLALASRPGNAKPQAAKYAYNHLMSELATDSSADPKLADLERRIEALETKVAAIPDSRQIEEHVTERVKASLPPPVDAAQAPSFKDIELPIPSVQNVVAAAKTTWAIFEILNELRVLFWTLFDRRYHMAWITRFVTIGLLILIVTSQWWVPLAKVEFVGPLLDKVADLVLGLILFMVLNFETRRYKEWRSQR
jgi:hypothetical protein